MTIKSRLIYKSNNTCYQTYLPVYFYGMPDGRMLVCHTKFRSEDQDDTTQEWVVALHLDFTYDYESDIIYTLETQEVDIEEFMELADTLEQRVKPLKTFGKFYNNTEAQQFFNQNGKHMLQSVQHMKLKVIEFYPEY